jgi:hypothetical protein
MVLEQNIRSRPGKVSQKCERRYLFQVSILLLNRFPTSTKNALEEGRRRGSFFILLRLQQMVEWFVFDHAYIIERYYCISHLNYKILSYRSRTKGLSRISVTEIAKRAIRISRRCRSGHSNHRYVPRTATQKYKAKSSKNVTVIS